MLRTARSRMRALVNDNNARIQQMLASLLVEAGWTEQEFLEALLADVQENGREKWMVPAPSPVPAPPGSLEGLRRLTQRPPPRKSGLMPKVELPREHKHKKAAG